MQTLMERYNLNVPMFMKDLDHANQDFIAHRIKKKLPPFTSHILF